LTPAALLATDHRSTQPAKFAQRGLALARGFTTPYTGSSVSSTNVPNIRSQMIREPA